jgi:TPR repeat protein
MSDRRLHIVAILCILSCIATSLHAQSDQKHPNSPVFKDYREQRPRPLLIESDVTYQLWQTFILEQQANGGDVLAQHELGIRYLIGRGVSADTLKGAYWIQRAAAQKLTSAQFNLGILYYQGLGLDWNPFNAYQQFLAAAKKGMVEAEYVMGQFLTDNLVVPRDWEEAYRWVKLAADSGYAPAKESLKEFEKRLAAQTPDSSTVSKKDSLGSVVFLDFGKDSTSKADLTMLKDVLESGGEELRQALGLASMLEGTLEIDSTEMEAIRRAAEDGSPEALAVLGRCHERGLLMKTDLVLAAEMYIRALRLGSPRASELLWTLLQEDGLYARLKVRSASGDVHANYVWPTLRALGFDGILQVKQSWISDDQALKLVEQAAERRHLPAMVELGLCYYSGRWVSASQAKAMEFWTKAARLGSQEAKIRIAITQVRSQKPDAALEPSIQQLDEATHAGSVLAQVALGYCYEHGIGVPRSKPQAARLYRSAAQRGSQDAIRALKNMHDEIRPSEKEFRVED